jgi:MFS family permease
MTKAPNIKAALKIPKNSLTGSFLVANAFVWYVCAFSFLQYLSESHGYGLLPVVTVNLATLIISAFAVALITSRFKNNINFLKYWIAIGVLLSLFFAVLNTTDFYSIIVLSAVVGVYFGFGMPTCTAYFAQQTQPQNRAKASGLIILILGVGYTAITLLDANTVLIAAVLAAWRITSLLPILRSKTPQEDTEVKDKKVTYRSILQSRAFLLYTVPWLMFSLINDLTMELNKTYFNSGLFPAAFAQNYMLIENVLAGASAIICGVLADKNGRKRLALVAFVLLGIGYASLGLFSELYVAALFYVCVDGFAWGAFMMLFLFTVWGDIAHEKGAEKFYFLGVLPYLFSNFIRVGFGQPIASGIGETVVFSFASFFLFLAILPLAYAPETLPEKIMKKAELDNYIEKALLKVQKENSA